MQYKSFIVPVFGEATSGFEDELNAFLRGHRVLSVHRELVSREEQSFWCFSVEFLESKGGADGVAGYRGNRPDYRELLPPEEFARFRIMRDARKQLAEADGVPPYAILLDANLAELAKLPVVDEAALRKIKGFGEKKLARWGRRFLEFLALAGQASVPDASIGEDE